MEKETSFLEDLKDFMIFIMNEKGIVWDLIRILLVLFLLPIIIAIIFTYYIVANILIYASELGTEWVMALITLFTFLFVEICIIISITRSRRKRKARMKKRLELLRRNPSEEEIRGIAKEKYIEYEKKFGKPATDEEIYSDAFVAGIKMGRKVLEEKEKNKRK